MFVVVRVNVGLHGEDKCVGEQQLRVAANLPVGYLGHESFGLNKGVCTLCHGIRQRQNKNNRDKDLFIDFEFICQISLSLLSSFHCLCQLFSLNSMVTISHFPPLFSKQNLPLPVCV